jgi:putative ABC transport system permease protein
MITKALLIEAVDELARRKLRTALTLLGMVFGVGAIVAMLAVGEGSKREALRLVEQLGLHNLIVQSKAAAEDELKERRARSLGLNANDAAAALAVVPEAESVSLQREIKALELRGPGGAAKAQAFAVSESYAEHTALQIAQGRWFNAEDGATLAPVCVLGARLKQQLFGDAPALGGKVKLNHVWLQVVGVLAARDLGKQQFEGVTLGVDDERIFVPWDSALARFRFQTLEDEVSQFTLKLKASAEPASSARVLAALMQQRHNGVDDTTLIVPAGLYRQNQQTQRIFTLVMSSVAAVSLLVGGIGIMNIMLANVLERRREIGLKRAIGARKRDLVEQFLAEALVISVLGGLAGLAFGGVLAYAIAQFAGWQVAWSPLWLLLAVSACIAVGIGFGVYPARKAAALDPIAALRTDG